MFMFGIGFPSGLGNHERREIIGGIFYDVGNEYHEGREGWKSVSLARLGLVINKY